MAGTGSSAGWFSRVRRWSGDRRGEPVRPLRPLVRPGDLFALAGLVALALWLTGFFGPGFSEPIQHSAGEDWDWQLTLYSATAMSWLDFGRCPVWNPYTAGGVPLWTNPEFPGLHPAFALVTALGPEGGIKVLLLFHLVLGWAGLALLGRELGLRRPLDLLPVLLLAGCSVWNFRLMWGHVMFQGLGYLPWVWWLMLRSRGRPAWAAGAGLTLGLALLIGGHYVFLIGLVTTVAWTLFRLPAAPRRGLVELAAFLLPVALVGFGRWLPLALAAADAPRMTAVSDGGAIGQYGAWDLIRIWAGTAPLQGEHESQPTFHGWLPAVLLIPGLVAGVRRHRALLGVFLLSLALSLADNLPLNPYQALRALPGLEHFRYPERFALAYVPAMGLLCALGIAEALVALRRFGRAPLVAILLIVGGAAGWHALHALPPERDRFGLLTGTYSLPAKVDPDDGLFRQDPDAGWNYHALLSNRGCPACRDALGLPPPPQPWGDDLVELEPTGEIHGVDLAGSAIDVHVTASGASRLTVRQAARPGWRAEVDGQSRSLAVEAAWITLDLDPGEHHVHLRYRPPGGTASMLALGAAPLVVLLLALVPAGRGRTRTPGRG